MNTFIISYDLFKVGQNYNDLYDRIKTLASGEVWHGLDSMWIIKSTFKLQDVCHYLEDVVDKNDKVLVVQVKDCKPAWFGFDKDCSDWLETNL